VDACWHSGREPHQMSLWRTPLVEVLPLRAIFSPHRSEDVLVSVVLNEVIEGGPGSFLGVVDRMNCSFLLVKFFSLVH
jgi:hypothetical protein